MLSQVAERTTDMALRTRLLGRVAEVAADKLHQPDRVLKAYEGILATDPENRMVARAAADLYEKTERWGRLVATYEILLGPETAPVLSAGESLAILERARYICETKLDAKSLAFKWCARARRSGTGRGSGRGMGGLAGAAGSPTGQSRGRCARWGGAALSLAPLFVLCQ